jgi:hypothetical protein
MFPESNSMFSPVLTTNSQQFSLQSNSHLAVSNTNSHFSSQQAIEQVTVKIHVSNDVGVKIAKCED